MKTSAGRLSAVTGKDVSIDPAAHYDGWADDYEGDLLGTYGYCAHAIAASALAALLPDRTARILDIGCGTGLVGAELAALGFGAIDGVDISAKMLAKARARGVYARLSRADAGAGPAAPPGAYDAVISVGSFGLGHLGLEALPGLVAHARPGAPVVILMNAEPYIEQHYAGHLAALERHGIWTVARVEDHNTMAELYRPGKLILARRQGG